MELLHATGSGTSRFDALQFEEGSSATDFIGPMTYNSYTPDMTSAFYDANGKKAAYTYNLNADAESVRIDPAGLFWKLRWKTILAMKNTT